MTAIRQQYLKIKRQYPDALLFFRLGDFYETFDNDAGIVSRELEIQLTSREMGKGNKVPLAGIPYHAVDNYLAKLINKGYKVAICEQVSQPQPGRKIIEREVIRVITPGTIVEPNMLHGKTNNYLMALTERDGEVGLAYVDITTGEFSTTQLIADNALPEIDRIQPSEILVDSEFALLASHKTHVFDQTLSEEESVRVLLEHFNASTLDGYGCTQYALAIRAAAIILRYLEMSQRGVLTLITRLSTYSTKSFMIIDPQTKRNLELFQTAREGTTHGSLLTIIDLTKTSMGGRLLRKWLGQPLLNLSDIKQRQDSVSWFYESSLRRARIIDSLNHIGDMERIINRIGLGIANPRELITLKNSLEKAPEIRSIIEKDGFADTAVISNIKPCSEVIALLQNSILKEPVGLPGNGGVIAPGFSNELDEIRLISKNAKKYLAELERSEKERTGIKSLKVGYNRVFGYFIEITTANLNQVPEDYIRKQTLVNGERFFTPQLKEYESMILNAQSKIGELEVEIYRQVCMQIAAYAGVILAIANALAHVDVLSTLGEIAVKYGYIRPEVSNNESIIIREGRHPVVECFLTGESFVPNPTSLSNSDEQLIILTGPNMSGKSTYLKQVALIVLLAQIGSFVPAEYASIGIVDRIFTRIGAQEDLASGQSTFMVEMIETSNILNNATSKSLIILDEIGRGTSTYDGLSIAHAVAEYIHNHPSLGSKTIFATHYHELVALSSYLPRVKNYNVAVTEEGGKVVFLRKIVPGGTDKSYGIHVARLAGLPRPVIHRAEEVLNGLEMNRELQNEGMKSKITRRKQIVQQLTLLGQSSPVIDELRTLDIATMTPLDAITKLYELQKMADLE